CLRVRLVCLGGVVGRRVRARELVLRLCVSRRSLQRVAVLDDRFFELPARGLAVSFGDVLARRRFGIGAASSREEAGHARKYEQQGSRFSSDAHGRYSESCDSRAGAKEDISCTVSSGVVTTGTIRRTRPPSERPERAESSINQALFAYSPETTRPRP